MKSKLISLNIFIVVFVLLTISHTAFLIAQSGQIGFSSIMIDKSSAGTITQATDKIIEDANQNWSLNKWAGNYIHITSGSGSGQIRSIISNTATTLTVSPSFVNAPDYSSGYEIRQGYKESSQNIKLKIYIRYNDGNRKGGHCNGYSCRIQASDTGAVEFVSVEKGSDLDTAWTPNYFVPPGQGRINWLILQFPEYHTLASGLYNIATVTVNLLKTDVDKPVTFFITNCPNGGLPIGATEDSQFFFFDTTSNDTFSGREEIFVLHNTNGTGQLLAGGNAGQSTVLGSYPNPFNPATTIRYELTEYSQVHLVIFDMLGRLVGELVNSQQYEGIHSVTWAPHNVSSGIYFARLSIEGSVSNQKEVKTLKLAYAR
ncbi:MAG: T9SS type A sorting domain-containing protein [Bacteroidota bacterium]